MPRYRLRSGDREAPTTPTILPMSDRRDPSKPTTGFTRVGLSSCGKRRFGFDRRAGTKRSSRPHTSSVVGWSSSISRSVSARTMSANDLGRYPIALTRTLAPMSRPAALERVHIVAIGGTAAELAAGGGAWRADPRSEFAAHPRSAQPLREGERAWRRLCARPSDRGKRHANHRHPAQCAEEARWNLVEGQRLPRTALREANAIERQSFDLGRRKPAASSPAAIGADRGR